MASFSGGAGLPSAPRAPSGPRPTGGAGLPTVPRAPQVAKGRPGNLKTIKRSLPHGLGVPIMRPGGTLSATPAASPGVPTDGAASPYDATFYGNVALQQKATGDKIAALNQANTFSDTGLQQNLANLARQEPINQLNLMEQANRGGGLYSSVYSQHAGNLADAYRGQVDAATLAHAIANAGNTTQIGGLQNDLSQFIFQQGLDSAGRATNNTGKDLTLGMGPTTKGGVAHAGGIDPGYGRVAGLVNSAAKGRSGALTAIPRRGVGAVIKGRPGNVTTTKGKR